MLNLINDILDLSKIESGTVTVEAEEISFASLRESVERSFRHIAEARVCHLLSNLILGSGILPQRLQAPSANHQDLLSNAFKFTSRGQVRMEVRLGGSGWSPDHPSLSRADAVVALTIIDTGIGCSRKQRLIFEAFQQADAGTSRSSEARALAWPFHGNLPRCSVAKYASRASPHREAPLHSFFRSDIPARRRLPLLP